MFTIIWMFEILNEYDHFCVFLEECYTDIMHLLLFEMKIR
jgi:hypothetical protein